MAEKICQHLNKPPGEKKYWQYMYLMKDSYPEYIFIKKCYISVRKRQTAQIFKWTKDVEKPFTKEDTQLDKILFKNSHLTSFVIRETQI